MTARQHRAPSVFGGELVLSVDGREASLISNGTFLMSTATSRSERLLGALVATAPAPARVLVAGLGLGITTTTVLADPDVAAVTVVEIEPALMQWWHDELQPPDDRAVDDARLTLVVDDVATWWAARAEAALADRLGRHFAEVRRLDVPVRRGDPDVIYWCRGRVSTTAERA